MENDIVERLRAYAKVWGNEPSIPPHPGTSPGFTTGMVIGDANDAADEIERLREALRYCADIPDHRSSFQMIRNAQDVARKALGDET